MNAEELLNFFFGRKEKEDNVNTEIASAKLSDEPIRVKYFDGKLRREVYLTLDNKLYAPSSKEPWDIKPEPENTVSLESTLNRKMSKKEVLTWIRKRYKGLKLPSYWLEYTEAPITITQTFMTYPTGMRGDRGFLLEERAEDLLPSHLKAAYLAVKEKYGQRLVYVNGGAVALPVEYYRVLRKSKKEDKDQVEMQLGNYPEKPES